MLEWDDLLARAKFVMGENIVKNSVEAGEFNEFLQEHGAVEQFVRIFGVAIQEKIFMYFTPKSFCCAELFHCKSYKKCMQSV